MPEIRMLQLKQQSRQRGLDLFREQLLDSSTAGPTPRDGPMFARLFRRPSRRGGWASLMRGWLPAHSFGVQS